MAGVVAFLAFLLFAVQVTYDLYATSAVTSAAFEAVRVVAGADSASQADARSEAEAAARRVLGKYGERVEFTWADELQYVSLRVRSTNPSFLPAVIRRPLGIDVVDRTVRSRVERVQ